MRTLILNIGNENDYQILFGLVKRLGIDTADMTEEKEELKEEPKKMGALYKLLDSVKKNELFMEIKNPVQWQRKLRNEWR